MATSSLFTTREGFSKTETQWHTVIFWNKLAELAGKYLKKGMLVFIEGELRSRQFEDKQGIRRQVTEIMATKLVSLEGSKEGR